MLTFKSPIALFIGVLLVLLTGLFGVSSVKGQRVYATNQRNGTTGGLLASGTVTNPGFSVDNNYNNVTNLSTTSTLGIATAWVQLIFSSVIPGKSTIFVKINSGSSTTLLGGEITVKTYSSSTTSTDGTQVSVLGSTTLTGPDGSTYLAVTPTLDVNAIRVTLSSPVALGANSADVFYAFYEPPSTGCSTALATSTAVSGIAVGSGVDSPNKAIDGNLTTNSTLSVGLLGVAASIKQTAYFSSLSNPGDAATVTFSVPPALLTLGLFNGITLTAYNGPTQVGTPIAFSSLLSLNLLFLGGGNRYTASFIPTGVFDRIEISTSSLISVLGSLYLYEIQRTPAKPLLTPPAVQDVNICPGSAANLSATAPATGNENRWYSSINDGTVLATGNTYSPAPLTTTTYYVAAAKIGCTAESERVPITVTVNVTTPGTIGSDQTLCSGFIPAAFTNTLATGAGTISYQWQKSTDNITFINISGATNAAYSEPAAIAQTTYYQRIATSTLNTVACSATSNKITVTVNLLPTIILNASYSYCQGSTSASLPYSAITAAPTTYSITWTGTAITAGFSNITNAALPATPIIITVPALAPSTTYSGSITVKNVNGCVSVPTNFNIVVHPKPPTPHITAQ